ncbi:MAG: acylphosphatase [Actinomycetota bacterium]|nr:acylphosphatase [Actinomycetota bacterium]
MLRRRVIVRGRVQGVFFRATCADEARARSVGGWVSNQPDGTVEAVFEGDHEAVTAMVDWCRAGPPYAEVTGVEVREEPALGESTFTVR